MIPLDEPIEADPETSQPHGLEELDERANKAAWAEGAVAWPVWCVLPVLRVVAESRNLAINGVRGGCFASCAVSLFRTGGDASITVSSLI